MLLPFKINKKLSKVDVDATFLKRSNPYRILLDEVSALKSNNIDLDFVTNRNKEDIKRESVATDNEFKLGAVLGINGDIKK